MIEMITFGADGICRVLMVRFYHHLENDDRDYWGVSSLHFERWIFSRMDLFQDGSFPGWIFSRMDLFQDGSLPGWIFSAMDLFRDGSFPRWIFSAMEKY